MNNVTILRQGTPLIEAARVVEERDDIVLIDVALWEEGYSVSFHGAKGGLPLVAVEYRLEDLAAGVHARSGSGPTELAFPSFAGWRVWAALVDASRLRVCLVRPELLL